MLLPDHKIKELAIEKKMIDPFVDHQVREADGRKVISYGLSSFGYDIRVGEEFRIFQPNPYNAIVDPKAPDERAMQRCMAGKEGYVFIPPNSYALGSSYEYMHIPEDVMCIVLGKSTFARSGIIINVTPLEPGWEGNITIEISNATPLPAKIYAKEGIAQVIFFREEHNRPDITYASRSGKYQAQKGVTLAKV